MTEAELILADILLLKFPAGRQIDTVAFMGSHLFEDQREHLSRPVLDEIAKIITSRSDVIRTFLIKERYIEVVNYMTPWDAITEKGEKAKALGGHKKYVLWDAKRKKYKKWKEIAFWILFAASLVSGIDVLIKWFF